MSAFLQQLKKLNSSFEKRRWIYVPYDQLSDDIGPLSREKPSDLGIILIENRWKPHQRPYHKQKLALILANQRHFALEQARRKVAVAYLFADGPYHQALEKFIHTHGPVRMMEAAEFELRHDLTPLVQAKKIQVLPHEGWLTSTEQFRSSQPKGPPFRMDAFYRKVRIDSGILMEKDKPIGGKFSFDAENRERWDGSPKAPTFPEFPSDPIKQEVGELIEREFPNHPGQLQLSALPCTKDDAKALWSWAKKQCLPLFGPYEDAMHTESRGLFHTKVSMLLNLHRLLPRNVVEEAAAAKLPLPSQEGFIRQILGWREFVRHVHTETDGFRKLAPTSKSNAALPNFLAAETPLPKAFWDAPSGLNCLDEVVKSVWEEGYSHHITRLMILSNISSLLDISPRELTDWFWVAYVDAFDWVVEPNVLGMGTYALGPWMTTKPYVSGAPYIQRMSNYCDTCAFDAKKNCPITPMYWAFLARHEDKLKGNIRLAQVMSSLKKRSAEKKAHDAAVFQEVVKVLGKGKQLSPDVLPKAPKA